MQNDLPHSPLETRALVSRGLGLRSSCVPNSGLTERALDAFLVQKKKKIFQSINILYDDSAEVINKHV